MTCSIEKKYNVNLNELASSEQLIVVKTVQMQVTINQNFTIIAKGQVSVLI